MIIHSINSSGTKAEIVWGNLFKSMIVDTIAPYFAKSPVVMVFMTYWSVSLNWLPHYSTERWEKMQTYLYFFRIFQRVGLHIHVIFKMIYLQVSKGNLRYERSVISSLDFMFLLAWTFLGSEQNGWYCADFVIDSCGVLIRISWNSFL